MDKEKYLPITEEQFDRLPDNIPTIQSKKTGKRYLVLTDPKKEKSVFDERLGSKISFSMAIDGSFSFDVASDKVSLNELKEFAHVIKKEFSILKPSKSKGFSPRYVG